jgi:tol-pal system beta propeller repeat protein TolB
MRSTYRGREVAPARTDNRDEMTLRRCTATALVVPAVALAGCGGHASAPAGPAASPDLILFSAGGPGGVDDLYVVHSDGSGVRRLTRNPAREFTASWSPHRRRIVYRFQTGSDDTSEIYVADADGSHARALTHDGVGDWAPALSPDGTRIAFASGGDPGGFGEIYIMNLDGSGLRRLTRNTDIDEYPAWSPDGRRIVFSSTAGVEFSGESRALWVMDADGTHLRRLTRGGYDMRPAWSPDGRRIAFESNRGASPGLPRTIWVMNADGTHKRRIIHSAGEHPAWSPDGTRIAFAAYPRGIGIVAADGSGRVRVIAAQVGAASFPAWG